MRAFGIAEAVLGCCLAFAVASGTAQAQTFSRLEPREQAVTLEVGLQSGIATTVGYAAGVRVDALDRTVMPFLQATLLVVHPDLSDYAASGGAQVSLVRMGWFDLSAQAAFQVEGTANSIHRATALRTDLALLAGHYAQSWFLLGEFGYDHAWMTYIKSTSFHRSFFPQPRDGWYANTAVNLRLGLKGGFKLGGAEVLVRVGANQSEGFNSLNLPYYATLGANYRF